MPTELLCLKANPDAPALICFANAGGSSLMFRQWGKPLMSDLELWALQLPARPFSRDRDHRWTSISTGVIETAELITRAMANRQFALLGHSMGALIAFETARQMRHNAGVMPTQLFLSSYIAAHLPKPATSLRNKAVAQMSDAEMKTMLGAFAGTPQAVLDDAELMALSLPTMRADFDLLDRYEYRAEPPLDINIVAFGGRDDQGEAPLDGLRSWQSHSSHPVSVHLLPGGHFYLDSAAPQMHAILRHYLLPDIAY